MSITATDALIGQIDWDSVSADLDAQRWTVLPALIEPDACDGIAALYDDDTGFRSRVVMARHGFGRGEYRYFSYPLPRSFRSFAAVFIRS